MRRTAASLLPAMHEFNRIFPTSGVTRAMTSLALKKQEDTNFQGGIKDDKADPVVAFSKPPPLPPVLEPVVLLSLFETWSSHDSKDD
ncbi:hypothetical protein RJ641_035578 [Dillenia turbinata]|uniref:Uncharacterized protein n=1 Tax=Dillenia turbinata TaxID=194707 RepID=A0AAN8VI04_9MAGN